LPKQKFTLLSWNVNGIRSAEKKGFLTWINAVGADLICVQETKAHPEQLTPALRNPEGFFTSWASANRKGYSGVATFSKRQPVQTIVGCGAEEFDLEGRVIQTDFEEFTHFNIYFPNGQRDETRLQYKLKFYEHILDVFEGLRRKGRKVVIAGDVNTAHQEIDLARPKENSGTSGFLPIERAWIDKLVKLGYIDSLREFRKDGGLYTWWDQITRARERNVGWRIDYHIVSPELRPHLDDAWTSPEVMGSDHCPVGLRLVF
jgi:exodeoxyribonuclease-3